MSDNPKLQSTSTEATPQNLDGERRQVTALFADVVGSTAITERIGGPFLTFGAFRHSAVLKVSGVIDARAVIDRAASPNTL